MCTLVQRQTLKTYHSSAKARLARTHSVRCGTAENALALIASKLTETPCASNGLDGLDRDGLTLFKHVLEASSTPQARQERQGWYPTRKSRSQGRPKDREYLRLDQMRQRCREATSRGQSIEMVRRRARRVWKAYLGRLWTLRRPLRRKQ